MGNKISQTAVTGLVSALAGKAPTGDYATNTGVASAIATAVADARPVLGTAQTTTSGTAKDFTGIPSYVKKITVIVTGFSHASGSNATPIIQLGTSSGIETTGYASVAGVVLTGNTTGTGTVTTGCQVTTALTAAAIVDSAIMTIVRAGATNLWQFSCTGSGSATGAMYSTAGYKLLSGALDRLRLNTVEGATFDAGTVNILYE